MPVLASVAIRNYGVGTATLGPVTVPLGVTRVRVRASRENWDEMIDVAANHEVLRVRIEGSLDGGLTWRFLFGFGAQGGQPTLTGVGVPTESWGRSRLPQPDNPLRRLRAQVQTRIPLRTGLVLEVE